MYNWRKMLMDAFAETGDDFNKMQTTLTDDELDKWFYGGYGFSEGEPFTAWGENYVYFPVVYDGAEWVGYVPRNPCDIKTNHIGGQ